jgi:fluoroacetyl-CoA thioesterase
MNSELKIGLSYTATQKVGYDDTASKYGSGLIEVFATPAMIALMENASLKTVFSNLPKNYTTVGFVVNIRHIKPTPIGMTVTCTATLIKIEGKKLFFELLAKDEDGIIGKGTHTRYIIDNKKFMQQFNK